MQLLFLGSLRADELQSSDKATEQESVTAPEQHDMTLVPFKPWVVEGEVLGTIAAYVYEDVTTQRPADYWELYDKNGDLLAVSWFDKAPVSKGPLSIAELWKRKIDSRDFSWSS